MHFNPLFSRQCKTDCGPIPPCVCPNAGDTCSYISQSCDACTSIKCTPPAGHKSSKGVSAGTLAGAVVAIIIVAVAVIFGVLYYRRKNRIQQAAAANREKTLGTVPPHTPGLDYNHLFTTANSEPLEKPSSPVSGQGTQYGSIGAVHSHSELSTTPRPASGNPFSDTASVSTSGSQGTNVIPIAFVPPAGNGAEAVPSGSRHPSLTAPYRPERAPNLNIRLENEENRSSTYSHNSSLHPPNVPYAGSQRSGMTASTMDSMMSDSSSVVYDQPVIVAAQGGIHKVLGVSRPEVVTLPGSGPTSPTPLFSATSSLFPPGARGRASSSRPPLSPLASSSFTAGDPLPSGDPFADEARTRYYSGLESVPEVDSLSIPPSPAAWSARSANDSRPSSVATQNGTVIATVGNARRVVLGSQQPRVTSPTTPTSNFLPLNDEIDIETEAETVRSKFSNRRSSVSSRADSILSGFAFVPPSPIANNHPTSPQGVSFRPSSIAESTRTEASAVRPSINPAVYNASLSPSKPLSPPFPTDPSRHTLGLSSTSFAQASPSGLEHFSFQFSESPVSRLSNVTESGSGTVVTSTGDSRSSLAPTESSSPHTTRSLSRTDDDEDRSTNRASLDTLELSRSLAAYPLGGYDDAEGSSPQHESFQRK